MPVTTGMTALSPIRKRTDVLLEEAGTAKIHPAHRDRLAMVYVRQSTPQQVFDH